MLARCRKTGHINRNERKRKEKEKKVVKKENGSNIKTEISCLMIVLQRRTALFVDDRNLLLLHARFLSRRCTDVHRAVWYRGCRNKVHSA